MAQNALQEINELGESVDRIRYQELAGVLLFLPTRTTPDISYAVGMLCPHSQDPRAAHWTALKRVLRYVKGTAHYRLIFQKLPDFRFIVYSDAD